MAEHLTREQIAALLDEPESVPGGSEHLGSCEACAAEFEGMSRMRMALSGLPDLTPPPGEWAAIRAVLPRQSRLPWFRAAWTAPVAAAAVVLLFLAGLGVGRMIAPGTEELLQPATEITAEPQDDYLETLGRLRELRDEGRVGPTLAEDPALAAERLTRLDALIDATRESLRIAPADPVLNDFLFDVVDERASLAGRLDQSLRQASMEY